MALVQEKPLKQRSSASPLTKNVWWLPGLRLFCRFAFNLCGGLTVEGMGNIPKTGRVLLCPSHVSDCDPCAVLVACARNDLSAMAKSELFAIPVLGTFIRAAGAFPVKRDSADRTALRHAEELLLVERALLLFPEGRCSPNGRLQPVQPGAALLALKTETPILPIGLIRTNSIVPYGEIRPRRVKLGARVVIGKLIEIEEFKDFPHRQAIGALTERLTQELKRLTGQNSSNDPTRLFQREAAP